MGIFNTGRLTADPYIFFYRFYSKRYCDYDFGCLYRPVLKKADRKNFKLICFLYNKKGVSDNNMIHSDALRHLPQNSMSAATLLREVFFSQIAGFHFELV